MVDKDARLPNIFYRFLISRNLISISFTTFIVYYLWIIVEKFRSVFLAGLIATIYLAVQLISSIPIGHLIDRLNNTVLSLTSSLVTLFGFTFLLFGNSIFIVYSATVLITLGLTLKGDSFSAIIKKHLKDDLFRRANSRNYAAMSFSTLIGTALGGLSILYLGRYLVYILLAIVVVSILSSLPVEEEVTAGISASAIGELYSALGFFRKILGFVILGFILNGLIISLEVYSSGLFYIVLKTSSIYYTVFTASIPVGMTAGSAISGYIKAKTDNAVTLSLLITFYAPLLILLGISRNPILDIIDALVIGILLPVINIPLQTKFMQIVPRHIYGKVSAFLRVFLGGSTPAMAAIFSFIAIYFRVDIVLLFVGIAMFPVSVLGFMVLPKFMGLESEGSR